MSRPSPLVFFKQSLKSDSFYADEIINIYVLRPIAAMLVWLLYPTRVTPNHVTIAAIAVGFIAAGIYTLHTETAIAFAGILVILKDIIDDADGQLARAKQLYSRRGRFLDSIGDFLVNIALFSAITYVVYRLNTNAVTILFGILSFIGITLRVSYHVFYQVSFLHLEERYKLNRIAEEITEEDRQGDPVALRLQQIFILIYGWQDRLMYRIDEWCRKKRSDKEFLEAWYSNKIALRFSGLLGFGTELTLLMVCSLYNQLDGYFLLNVFLMNGIWAINIVYRKYLCRSI
ncbi:MAG: CDP-alcohol phosphatidyltransferase family protein [Bacteroidetes bacterium]|nr:MAG: CDP-alcohol phosphatidyltransferase family protein [Bacteroidota bacterium]